MKNNRLQELRKKIHLSAIIKTNFYTEWLEENITTDRHATDEEHTKAWEYADIKLKELYGSIKHATQCKCGAYTIHFKKGFGNSMSSEYFKTNFPNIEIIDTYIGLCDHCINNYGLDLCLCGSHKHPIDCCDGKSSQEFGTERKLEYKFN